MLDAGREGGGHGTAKKKNIEKKVVKKTAKAVLIAKWNE